MAKADKRFGAAAACCLFPICLSRFFCYFNMAYVLFCLLKWTTRQKTVSHPAFPDVYDSYTNLCDVIHIPCSPSCAESCAYLPPFQGLCHSASLCVPFFSKQQLLASLSCRYSQLILKFEINQLSSRFFKKKLHIVNIP